MSWADAVGKTANRLIRLNFRATCIFVCFAHDLQYGCDPSTIREAHVPRAAATEEYTRRVRAQLAIDRESRSITPTLPEKRASNALAQSV